jgi:hypothetical protein
LISKRKLLVKFVASVVGKLLSMEPALGNHVLVGTRMSTIAIVEAMERRSWKSWMTLSQDAIDTLRNVLLSLGKWNGHPIRAFHTGITLASILPGEHPNSVARKIPARRVELNQAVIASDASDFAVASYCLAELPYFEFLLD